VRDFLRRTAFRPKLPTCFPAGRSWEAEIREAPGFIGERGGTRTLDPMIKSHVLYHLSYALTAALCRGRLGAGQ
jgi:hypothetical protein